MLYTTLSTVLQARGTVGLLKYLRSRLEEGQVGNPALLYLVLLNCLTGGRAAEARHG